MWSNVCLCAARLLTAGWVGAAALFVVNGVLEVTSPQFDSLVRDQLVLIRFPAYYLFGFVMVLGGLLATACAGRILPGRRRVIGLVLLTLALALMIYDWLRIYSPLQALLSPPGQPRTPDFRVLHVWSEVVNTIDVTLALAAAVVLCWPTRPGGTLPSASAPP
ncbi:MAG: hypothetical protein KF774_10735 [Planctomyces sp.]|nr:hypothetical protein [Planctomyces sp.]